MENHVASAESDAISVTATKDLSNEFDLDSLLQSDGFGETSDLMTNKYVDDFVDLFEFLLQVCNFVSEKGIPLHSLRYFE